MPNPKIKSRRGFTLSEVLVVVVMIAIMAAVATPLYTKSIKRSRASDALSVLALASAKQEAYFIEHGRPAQKFQELAVPVQGLTGDTSVALDNFTYQMQGNCFAAARPADNYTLYKNYITKKESCSGAGCSVLEGLIPSDVEGVCSEGDSSIIDDSGAGGALAERPDDETGGCRNPNQVYNPVTKECQWRPCADGSTPNPINGACTCSNTCNPPFKNNNSCECVCPTDRPYQYDGTCNKCLSGYKQSTDGICRQDPNRCAPGTTAPEECGNGGKRVCLQGGWWSDCYEPSPVCESSCKPGTIRKSGSGSSVTEVVFNWDACDWLTKPGGGGGGGLVTDPICQVGYELVNGTCVLKGTDGCNKRCEREGQSCSTGERGPGTWVTSDTNGGCCCDPTDHTQPQCRHACLIAADYIP